jgi:hypothetical protein
MPVFPGNFTGHVSHPLLRTKVSGISPVVSTVRPRIHPPYCEEGLQPGLALDQKGLLSQVLKQTLNRARAVRFQ